MTTSSRYAVKSATNPQATDKADMAVQIVLNLLYYEVMRNDQNHAATCLQCDAGLATVDMLQKLQLEACIIATENRGHILT